jgi:uncharacterized protein YpiB (UPF0302 family)
MNYSEQLKSPLWQKKRLEIMQKDNFTCQICGDKDSTLNVHHLHYEKGKLIHEYDDKCLITLCETCHKNEHEWQQETLKSFLSSLMEKNITMFEIVALIERVDVALYMGHKNYFTEIVGDGCGCHSENEIKNLEDRRNGI